jgi:hypothetical protein
MYQIIIHDLYDLHHLKPVALPSALPFRKVDSNACHKLFFTAVCIALILLTAMPEPAVNIIKRNRIDGIS